MAPHVDTLIVNHEKRSENSCLCVESNPVASEDVLVVSHELRAVLLFSYVKVLFNQFNSGLFNFDLISLLSLSHSHAALNLFLLH